MSSDPRRSPTVTKPDDPVEWRRELAERATARPWRWAGYIPPDRIDLPEIRTINRGQIRVLAFVARHIARVIDKDEYTPVDIEIPAATRLQVEDELREPRMYEVNKDGEIVPDGEGDAFVYVESGQEMCFQADGIVAGVGSEHVPVRWDCYGGATTEEAGREPYRYDVAGIAHPDAELLVQAVNDYLPMLAIVEAARSFLLAEKAEDEAAGALADHRGDLSHEQRIRDALDAARRETAVAFTVLQESVGRFE